MGSLRDFSMDAWEAVFNHLEPRHVARLVETGDRRVLYAIEHAWRRCDVVDFGTIVPHGLADSDLMKRTLIGRARRLSIRAGCFVHCGNHFPLLESLYLQDADTKPSPVLDEWQRHLAEHRQLDLETITPNLRSLKLMSNFYYRVTLPPQLEQLELLAPNAACTLSDIVSFESVANLTYLSILGGFTAGVLSSDLALPQTITSLSITLCDSDVPFIRVLPASITRLRIANGIGQIDTSSFVHLPLVELNVIDAYDGSDGDVHCTWLGGLPPSLTSLSVGRLSVKGTVSNMLQTFRHLPPTLKHISFTALDPRPSRNEMKNVLEVLSPRIDMEAMFSILLYCRKEQALRKLDDGPLEQYVLSMLKGRGSDADFVDMIVKIDRSLARSDGLETNPIASLIGSGMRPAYMARIVSLRESASTSRISATTRSTRLAHLVSSCCSSRMAWSTFH